MKEFSDVLIESYEPKADILVEAYVSQAANSEQDRLDAEKAFKAELSNGPAKSVYYANGIHGQKKVGSFDLDNFHKAYDKYFEDNNLLDIFADDGKLAHRGTYGRFANLDKTEPAIKALRTLFGAQFNRDMEFFDDKKAKLQTEQDRRDIYQKFNSDVVLNKITSTKEWKELLDTYPAEDRENIHIEIDPSFSEGTNIKDIRVDISGVLLPPASNSNNDTFNGYSRFWLSQEANVDLKKQTEDELIKLLIHHISLKVSNIIKTTKVIGFFARNYEAFLKRPESQLDKVHFNWLVYFNRDTKTFYKTKMVTCDRRLSSADSTKGLILINIDDPTDKAAVLDFNCILVAARTQMSSTSNFSGTYRRETYQDYYNSSMISQAVLDKLGVITHEVHQGFCGNDVTIKNSANFDLPELSKFFDVESHYYYECDSSD